MAKKVYEAPVVRVVGSLQGLTQTAKNLDKAPDGFTFFGLALTS